jgi:alkanesulfonate monooxygenase SsuD/methylene tetrahydromethanopterin reductase-like flavin-dependent oxidoreductase (luciferase family)
MLPGGGSVPSGHGSIPFDHHGAGIARQAEALGFDTLLMPDPFGPQFGPWAALDAAASVTSRLRLGTLVASNDFRHPLVLAKEPATVDVISAGRLKLSLGAGSDGSDYAEAGIALAGPAERIDLLAEAIAVLKAAFSGERFSFTGQHYPGPRACRRAGAGAAAASAADDRRGRPRLLGLAAREADIVTLCPAPGPTAAG